jgi:hypothetical protein
MLFLASLAAAATVTEIPPFLRGDALVGYTYEGLSGSLVEPAVDGDAEIARRSLTDHRLRYGVSFGAAPGVAVFLELPHYVNSSVSYADASTMVYDPASESGTYIGTPDADPGTYVTGGGLGGVWVGVRGTPWSEAFTSRSNDVTWLLEGAIRTKDPSNFWTASAGERGAGPGGTALRLHTAFSRAFGASEPYVSATLVSEGKLTADVVDESGAVIAQDVALDPSNTARLRFGVESTASSNDASGARLAFDVHGEVAYASWATLPSGVYLPNVLAGAAGQPVQQSEALQGGAGLAIHWRPMAYMQISLFGDAAYHLPQRVESPYPVTTGLDTIAYRAGSELTVRVR